MLIFYDPSSLYVVYCSLLFISLDSKVLENIRSFTFCYWFWLAFIRFFFKISALHCICKFSNGCNILFYHGFLHILLVLELGNQTQTGSLIQVFVCIIIIIIINIQFSIFLLVSYNSSLDFTQDLAWENVVIIWILFFSFFAASFGCYFFIHIDTTLWKQFQKKTIFCISYRLGLLGVLLGYLLVLFLLMYLCHMLTSDPAKHAIPKAAEVAYSIGVGELGWQYGTGLKSHGTVTNWCTGREWPGNCMTVISTRWQSNMPFQRWQKCIFRWPVMGKDWVGVELLYNSVHWKFNEFGDQRVGEMVL